MDLYAARSLGVVANIIIVVVDRADYSVHVVVVPVAELERESCGRNGTAVVAGLEELGLMMVAMVFFVGVIG